MKSARLQMLQRRTDQLRKKTSQVQTVSEATKIGQPIQLGQAQRHQPHDPDKSQQSKSTKAAAGISAERADILRRVASFRAHQVKLTRDRETYYERVQEQIRTSLDNPTIPKPL